LILSKVYFMREKSQKLVYNSLYVYLCCPYHQSFKEVLETFFVLIQVLFLLKISITMFIQKLILKIFQILKSLILFCRQLTIVVNSPDDRAVNNPDDRAVEKVLQKLDFLCLELAVHNLLLLSKVIGHQ